MKTMGQIFERGEKIEPKYLEQLPIGSAYREGVRFLELEDTPVEFYENEGQEYEVRWLGFGYSLVTPVEMSAECGTLEEENGEWVLKNVAEPGEEEKLRGWYKEEKKIAAPFIVWNGEANVYLNREAEVV